MWRSLVRTMWRSLVLLATVTVFVRADYQVEVRFFRYWNPSHRREMGQCCDGKLGDCTNADNDFCENFFQICVIPEGGRCGDQSAPFLVERRDEMLRDIITMNNDDLMFEEGEEAVQGLPNPVVFNISGPWPGDTQRLLVEVSDLDSDKVQFIGGFIVDLATVSPGNSTGPVQYSNNLGIRDNSVMNTFINMSISLRCAEDYYGPECNRLCVAEDSDEGHYTCDSEGFFVCRDGYRNTSSSCTQCVPAQGCYEVGGYCEEPGECICRPGYNGTFCELDVDPCGHMMPCENGATCINTGVGDFNCTCPEGFEGEQCQLIQTDECDPNLCQNGGTCEDLFMDYMCECVVGYEGKDCDAERDECLSNPCNDRGTCTDQFNDYTCQCVEGYEGKNCDINIDDCLPNPCLNGGTCEDLLADYQCSCTSDYTGRNCTDERGESSSQSLDAGVAGGIVGIAVLVIVVVLLVVVLVVVLKRKRRHKFVIAEKSSPGEHDGFTKAMETEESTTSKPSQGDGGYVEHEFDNPIYGGQQEDFAKPVKPVSTPTGTHSDPGTTQSAEGTGTGSSVEHEFGNPIYGDDQEEYATPIKPPAMALGEEPLHEYDYTTAPSGLKGPRPAYESADLPVPVAYTEPSGTIRAEVASPAHVYDYTTTQPNLPVYEDPSLPMQHYEMPTTLKTQRGLGGLDASEHYEFGPV